MAPNTSAKIAVIGGGYVGLPTAAVLAHFGHHVVLAESNSERHDLLALGKSPIVEQGLEELLGEGIGAARLRVVSKATDAVRGAEFVFLCVPTPQDDDGSADLSFVKDVAVEIREALEPGAIVINKSTVPAGTAALVERVTGRPDVTVVSNPEFLREGSAVSDSLNPDRIVVGSDDASAARRVGELFSRTGAPLIVTSANTAETIKYASNAFLATKVSFINAMAAICEAVGADVRDLIVGIGYDKRIGFEFLHPGPGWGGSCLPKDTAALLHLATSAGYDFGVLREAVAQNGQQFDRVIDKVFAALDGSVAGSAIGVWGLTFKANTDDRRVSPALRVARRLLAAGATVVAYDPTVAIGDLAADLDGISIASNPYEACRDAQVLVVLTEWDEFRWLDFAKVADLMAVPAVVDARNLLDPVALRKLGLSYTGIGRL
jgi:UDPglucose 6-dehydrogenase